MVGVNGVTIREAVDADVQQLAELVSQLGYPTAGHAVPRRLATMFAEGGQHVLVAVEDERVVGTSTVLIRHLLTSDAPVARLTSVVVAEDRRSLGIGQALVERSEELARDAGCDRMEVTSGTHRDRAHRFYERLGYEERPQRFTKSLREPRRTGADP